MKEEPNVFRCLQATRANAALGDAPKRRPPIILEDSDDDALVHLSNFTNTGGAVLVMGAAGKGLELKYKGAKPPGQPPIGSLAMACVQRCKQPVILVKSGPAPPTGGERIKRAGLDGTKGLNLMVTVEKDASAHVSRKAFDMALGFGTKGLERKFDTVFLYHAINEGMDLGRVGGLYQGRD